MYLQFAPFSVNYIISGISSIHRNLALLNSYNISHLYYCLLIFCACLSFSSLFDLYACHTWLLVFIVRQTTRANYSPWAQSGLLPIFQNNVLLLQNHTNSLHIVYACFRPIITELNSCDRNHIAQENKNISFYSGPLQTLVLKYKLFRDLVSFSNTWWMSCLRFNTIWYFYNEFIQPSIITLMDTLTKNITHSQTISSVKLKPSWKIMSRYEWIRGVILFTAGLVK